MAREPTTDNDDVECRRELRLIVALSMRLPTRPTRDLARSQRADNPDGCNRHKATTRQHTTRQRQNVASMTSPTLRAYNKRDSIGTNDNRYAVLDPGATCDDTMGTASTDGWTVVTRGQKRNTSTQREIAATPRTRNARVVERQAGTVKVEARVDRPTRGDAEVEAHVDVPTCGDAHAKVEAHAGVSARGDAHPPPIPSPDPGVTPLTKRLDAQSDVLGVARVRSPRMQQLLRRIQEVTDAGTTPCTPSNPDAPPNGQQPRPWTAKVKVSADKPTGGDACPSSSVCNIGVAPLEDDKESDDERIPPLHHDGTIGERTRDHDKTSDHKGPNEHTTELQARSSRILEMHRRVRAVTSTTTETLQVEEVRPSASTTTATTTADLTLIRADHDLDRKLVKSDQTTARRAGGRNHPRCTTGPVRRAEHYCQTLEPLTNEEKHDAISRYLMEGRWIDEEEEEDVPVEPAHKTQRVTRVNVVNCEQAEVSWYAKWTITYGDDLVKEEPSTSEPRTPAPSETSGNDSEETSNRGDESEIKEVIQTAESLRLNEPETIHIHAPAEMATATVTQEELATEEVRRITEEAEAYLRPINPATGHRMTIHHRELANLSHQEDPEADSAKDHQTHQEGEDLRILAEEEATPLEEDHHPRQEDRHRPDSLQAHLTEQRD
ncbi:hypothetical protein EDB83DRAFT_2519506 [Lactarius deliciosus]|nr:hypothetical protein EDB83DRAFT_2519506 [Lactarius deliciosus]